MKLAIRPVLQSRHHLGLEVTKTSNAYFQLTTSFREVALRLSLPVREISKREESTLRNHCSTLSAASISFAENLVFSSIGPDNFAD